ncbi:MAG: ATP-binding protein [Alphaproteobacteria bacterium]|nr:ATP-binding protein [Alphaproteobacteria bacterium]
MNYIKRKIKTKLLKALGVSPVVFLNGPRQAGKSTFVQALAKEQFPAEYVTFDNATQMAAATNAPESYLKERKGSLIIDEVQLVPEIFRPLKITVDKLRQESTLRGKFLLTGSSNIMALPDLSGPLVGRMNVLTLYPLSGAEVLGGTGQFIDGLFNKDFVPGDNKKVRDMMYLATFPEISGADESERTLWFDGYLTTILQRDVRALAEIEKLGMIPNMLRVLANRAGSLINDADIARDVGLNPVTSRNYKTLLKMLFLTFEVSPWYRNIGKRLVKAPKGYIIDTLLLCHLLQYEGKDLEINRPEIFGHVLENFVATELLKLMTFQSDRMNLYYFRTSDGKEVDFVLEKPNGQLVGIEVKKRDQVDSSDFKGLEELQSLTGKDFICGIVLYSGQEVVPFGKNLWAVPISNLWR